MMGCVRVGNCCRELPAACLSDLRAYTTEPRSPRASYKGRRSRTSPNHRYRRLRQQREIEIHMAFALELW